MLIQTPLLCGKYVVSNHVRYGQIYSMNLISRGIVTPSNSKESSKNNYHSNFCQQQKKPTSKIVTKIFDYNRLKKLLSQYGISAAGTYATIYVITFSTSFLGITYGYIDPSLFTHSCESPTEGNGFVECISHYLNKWQYSQDWIDILKQSTFFFDLAMAWGVTIVLGPGRLVLAVYMTPKVARIFGTKIIN